MILLSNLTTKIKGGDFMEYKLDFKFDLDTEIRLHSKKHNGHQILFIKSFIEGLRLKLNSSMFSDQKDFYLFDGETNNDIMIKNMYATDINMNSKESGFSVIFNILLNDIKKCFKDSSKVFSDSNPNIMFKKIIENYCITEGMYSEMNYYDILDTFKSSFECFKLEKRDHTLVLPNLYNLNSNCRKILEIKNLFLKEDIFEFMLSHIENKNTLIVLNNRVFTLHCKTHATNNNNLLRSVDMTIYSPSNFIKEFLIDHDYLYDFIKTLDDKYIITETNSKYNIFNSNEIKNINISVFITDITSDKNILFETSI